MPSGILRSLLFVPADSPSKLAKARSLDADALLLDLEDSVLPDARPAARRGAVEFIRQRGGLEASIFVRLNRVGVRDFEEDMQAISSCLPDGCVLSKCRSSEDVLLLEKILKPLDASAGCNILPLIESAQGLLAVSAVAACSTRVRAVLFGAEDFSADLGITRTPGEPELLYARCAIVTACRAASCQAIDAPCIEFHDLEQTRQAAQRARNLGFTGKLAIHPAQLPVLNAMFSPSEAEVQEAQRILAAYSASGAGVIAIDGRMIDEAVVRKARDILR